MERLFYYTTRVKQFEYRPSRRFDDDTDEALHRLALIYRNQPIFPSLSQLYLERTWPVSLSAASLLFSPSIRFLIIECVRESKQSWSKMNARQQDHFCTQMLIRRCPSILKFILRWPGPMPGDACDTFNIIFREMHTLESVSFFCWSEETYGPVGLAETQRCQLLQNISRLPHTSSLYFALDKMSNHRLSMTQLAEFCDLEQLTLHGLPRTMFTVVQSLKSPKLRAVVLVSYELFLTESDVHYYQKSVGFLASRARHTLRSLHLTEYVDVWPCRDRPNPMSFTTFIRGLHPLCHLEHLSISLPDIYVSDGDLITIANSLPRLRDLHIRLSSSPGTVVTYRALTELSARCTLLEQLCIPIFIYSFDNLGDVTSTESLRGPNNHPLRSFRPSRGYNGSLTDGEKRLVIAQAIYGLFPNIMVHQCVSHGGEYWWNDILQDILLLQEKHGSRRSPREDFEERLQKALKWGEFTTED